MTNEFDDSGGDAVRQPGREAGRDIAGERDGSLSTDTVFSILAHRHRRSALDHLQDHRATTLADLADAVAAREYDRPLEELPTERVKHIRLGLYHTHLPKLEAANLAVYDRSQDRVVAGPAIDRVAPFLALIDEQYVEAV